MVALLLTYFPDIGLSEDELKSAAESYIEAGIDLLLEEHDEELGKKIKRAALIRSSTIPSLLVKAYPDFLGKGLLAAEATFRLFLIAYGERIALPRPEDEQKLAAGIALLAKELYGVDVTLEQSLVFLRAAMDLCIQDDYFGAIEDNINQMSSELAPARPGSNLVTTWGEIKKRQ